MIDLCTSELAIEDFARWVVLEPVQWDDDQRKNLCMGLAQLGQTSAANVGSYGTQTAANIAQTQIGAGNAAAAGMIGSANALSSGIGGAASGVTNGFLTNSLLQGMYGSGGGNSFVSGVSPNGANGNGF